MVCISGRSLRGPAGIVYNVSVMFWIGLGLAWFAGLVSTIQSDIERAFNRKVETVNGEQDGKTCPEEVSVRTPFPRIFVSKVHNADNEFE